MALEPRPIQEKVLQSISSTFNLLHFGKTTPARTSINSIIKLWHNNLNTHIRHQSSPPKYNTMISSTRYETLKTIRPSIFGEILLCQDLQTKQQVVIKTVDLEMALKQTSKVHGVVKENIVKELEIMSFLKKCGGHPNVMSMRDYYVNNGTKQLNVVLDYCEGGDLLDIGMSTPGLEKSSMVSDRTAFKYFQGVISGLAFLHRHGIAHRDLSLENILIRNGQAIIADFGLCAKKEPGVKAFRCTELVGKHYYMAPEVIANTESYDPTKADVWSVGISFFILLTSSPPFEKATLKDAGFRYVANHGLKAVFNAWGLSNLINPALQDVLEQMTAIDPNQRLSLDEVQKHSVFKEMSEDDLNLI